MAETPVQNKFYQAPLEVPGYVSQSASIIPPQPIDLYGLMGLVPPKRGKLATRSKTPYELMMEGTDPFATLIPDVAAPQSSLQLLEPLDDPAGLLHSQDGFGKYGYSSILGGGDNENRYAENFRRDNPDLFWRPGFHPWEGIRKAFYWGGGFLEKTLESAVVKTGQGLAGLYGMTIGNTINATFGKSYEGFQDWLASATDNVFSNFFDSWDENLKERYHYFQEKSDRENKGFVESLGDGDFWMNDIADGLGFLISSLFEAGIVAKAGLGTKAATRLAPLSEGVSTSALAPKGIATARTGVFGGAQKALNTLGIEGTGHMFIKNAVDLTAQTLALTAIESAVEAQEVKDRVYQSFEGKINPETGYYYGEEEKRRLSSAAAGQVFKQNMSILAGPKFLEVLVFNRVGKFAKGLFNKSFGQASTEAGKASGAVRSRLGNLSSGTSYTKSSVLKDILKVGSLAGLGFVSEGLFEENVQLAISREAEDIFGAGDEYYRPGTTQADIDRMEREDELFGSVSGKYFKQTRQFFRGIGDDRFIDDELSKSVGIGGIFGIVGGAVHGTIGVRQQAKIDHFWNNRLKAATTNLFESNNFFLTKTEERADPENPGKTKPVEVMVVDPKTGQPVLDEQKLKNFLNKMNNIQGIMDIVSNTEDPSDENNKTHANKELNKLARNVLFANLAMEYIRAGKKDLLLSQLTSSSQFSDKDIQALGYEPGMMTENQKKQMLSRMVNFTNRLAKADEWIENNVLDNVSEPREGKLGLRYTKTQKEKRRQEFEAKKAYLRGLAMENALLDSYLDDIIQSEQGLGEPTPEILSSVLNEEGIPVQDLSSPVHLNARIPALRNQLAVLEKQFAYHWDNILSRERKAPKGQPFSVFAQTNNGKTLAYEQIRAQETLDRINELQEELDSLESEFRALRNNEVYETFIEDGETFVRVRPTQPSSLDQLEADKIRRINNVKREEIAIQKGWIEEEWRNVAALKEPKTAAGREDTLLSRRMSLSFNAYNTYFQREVMDRDNSLGQRKLKLFDKDPKKIITAKKYVNNENKLLKSVRIQGKVATILADVNGQKLIAELNALLDRDLPSQEFADELRKIIDTYNGKLMILSPEDKNLVDDQIQETQDEANFVSGIFEYMPSDERFNDKYYDTDTEGNFIIKPQYDGLAELAEVQRTLDNRIDDLEKIKKFLDSIPESIPGDWNNPIIVKKRIADVYTETADSIINTYNQLSNNGQSEIAGDSLSTKQDLDLIDQEIDELGQLKVIFETRNDGILNTPEFAGYIASIDKRIEELKKIREIVKERLSSRLRENQDFLIDAVNNLVEQLGLNFDGSTKNPPLNTLISNVATTQIYSKIVSTLQELKTLMDKEDKDADDRKAINDAYWTINGQVSAIQEVIKSNGRDQINDEIRKQKAEQIKVLEGTALMQKLKGQVYYKDITDSIDDSVLGALQLIFFQTEFSQVGVAGGGTVFLDDQPSSPVYKFREDYNLRKFLRNVEADNSRTPDNTEVSKQDLIEFLNVAKDIQNLEDLGNNINTDLNLLDQVEKEKEVVQAKIDKKDNKYENLIIPSVQQLFFIRKIAAFLRTNKVQGNPGFKNWIYIQAPGGAGKTQTLGTWFNVISGIPRDRILATAFTEEAARGIKKALLVGEEGPKDAQEMAAAIRELTRDKQFDHDVLIIDEFPAIDVQLQKELFEAVSDYTKAKLAAGKGEFKVITMGDTNQLTFSQDGSVIPRPAIIINPKLFGKDNHPAQMTIIPSLTVNFRSNLFAVTSFVDQFKGSNNDNVNAALKVTSTDPELNSENIKGVVSIEKGTFQSKLLSYLRLNANSPRTRALIVNEAKLDSYKRLLTDNGIRVITDPNDEVTKGVYVTSVKNVQGFSFDEVFVDLENNDKTLFSGTSSPNFIYNKAMYVAASRARNLIVVTNFSNFENVEDQSISALENKALDELQTKDADFIAQRDLEINGAKAVMGSEYNRNVKSVTPVQAEPKVETPLDEEEDVPEEDDEEPQDTEEEQQQNETPVDTVEDEQLEESDDSQEGVDESIGNEVVTTSGLEDNTEQTDVVQPVTSPETVKEAQKDLWNKIKDKTVGVYNKVRDEVVNLLFPTAQTTKYKIGDGQFTIKPDGQFENKALMAGDRVIVIPFQQSQTSKSPRKFGYAVITPSISTDGSEIPNSYRTVAVLSDSEIDKFKEKPETINLYNVIEENEKRDKGFVSIIYQDISDENGFTTSASKIINELEEGRVIHSNPVKYYYGDNYKDMNKSTMDAMINEFVEKFYANHVSSFPISQQPAEMQKIKDFYKNPDNAKIIIPTRKDVEGPKPLLNVPPELRGYVRAGRPYMMFRPFHKRSSMQFIALSRKFLDTKQHEQAIGSIRDFVNTAKAIKKLLESKGITSKLGYSRSLSNMLSKLANTYIRDSEKNSYSVDMITTVGGKRVTNTYTFTNLEAERIYNLFAMYSEPNTQMIKAETEKEIQNLTKVKKARNYTFDDGETIYGTIESYDPQTKTFVVRDIRAKESVVKSGVINHSSKAFVGKAQQAVDDVFNSNGNIASKFTSARGRIGFVIDRDRSGNNANFNKGYKFMALLGSKTAPVPKTYNNDGTPKEYYEDVIEILEDLFNFAVKGEMPKKTFQYIDEEGNRATTEVQFRVPVPLNARNQRGELEYDYTFTPQNTSRDTAIPNSRFFDTNFESILPTRVFVEFGVTPSVQEKQQTVDEFVNKIKTGQGVSTAEDLQFYENNKKEIERKLQEAVKESSVNNVKNLSKEDINTLSFNEIRNRLIPDQVTRLDQYAKKEGFKGIDHFFQTIESNHPEEQAIFRDYIIECLL